MFDKFDIVMKPKDGDPRFCDYCPENNVLVNEAGITIEQCFLTKHGLMCIWCFSKRRDEFLEYSHYKRGVNVKEERWYKCC